MPLTYDTLSPDSLEILIKKVNAIITINKENLNFIESRKGQKVIMQNQFTLNVKEPSPKKRKVSHGGGSPSELENDDEQLCDIVNKKITKEADDFIKSWRYQGKPLKAETIAFDNFLNLQLQSYNDLKRLNDCFEKLSEKYARVLRDQPESIVAIRRVLDNVEILQVAIGELHAQLLDAKDPAEHNKTVKQRILNMSRELKLLQQDLPRFSINLLSQNEHEQNNRIPSFLDITNISCKATLSRADASTAFALQDYELNGKTYLASGQGNGCIGLWNLENNSSVGTLDGHSKQVRALALYSLNGSQMLASGSLDHTIKLWSLENHSLIKTINDHTSKVWTLTVLKKNDKTILISASSDKTIRLHDLDDYRLIAKLTGHTSAIFSLVTYQLHNHFYLASASHDKTVKIWSLNDHRVIATLSGHKNPITALKIIKYNGKTILASLDRFQHMKIWDLEKRTCVHTFSSKGLGLELIQCNGKLNLVSGLKNIELWNLPDETVTALAPNRGYIWSLKAFFNGNKSCIACGDSTGRVQLWYE